MSAYFIVNSNYFSQEFPSGQSQMEGGEQLNRGTGCLVVMRISPPPPTSQLLSLSIHTLAFVGQLVNTKLPADTHLYTQGSVFTEAQNVWLGTYDTLFSCCGCSKMEREMLHRYFYLHYRRCLSLFSSLTFPEHESLRRCQKSVNRPV